MQALTVQWWLVVVLGGEGLGAAEGAALGAALLGANLVSIPVLRRARKDGAGVRFTAQLYIVFGISTLLIGRAVALSWIGLFPLAQSVGWLGLGAENAFLSFRVVSARFVFAVLGGALWAFTGGQKFCRSHAHPGTDSWAASGPSRAAGRA